MINIDQYVENAKKWNNGYHDIMDNNSDRSSETEMKNQGFGLVMTSTQVDESAQHFYRKLGYKDCGGFVIDIPNYEQPMEMFLIIEIYYFFRCHFERF